MTQRIDYVKQSPELFKRFVDLGKAIKAGESFGAAYILGWFDDIPAMNKVYDHFRGVTGIEIKDKELHLIGAKSKDIP